MDFLKNLSPIKLAAIISGGLAVLILLAVLSWKLASPPMSILYTNLSPEDSSLILSRLEGQNIHFEMGNSGKDILVPVSKVLMLRMSFAQEGIPSTGSVVGYEIFDKSEGLGTSQFVHNINLVRALEGELSRTIGSLNNIDSARVHLVLPKKELFSKTGSEPTASVVLRMKGNLTLSKNETAAISHIVATAVPGLRVDKVTIIDSRGRPLKLGANEDGDPSSITDIAADYQRNVEDRYKNIIENLIEKSVGVGKVKANVTAEINFDREVINSEVYDPEGQVIRSRKVSEQSDNEVESSQGETSVATNIAGGQGGSTAPSKNKSQTSEVTNYEISKTITNKISENGRIKKLSIAILVDGNYATVPNPGNPEDFTVNYSPRSDDELAKIKSLAASAVGIDPQRGDKIEVVNMKFSDEFATLPQKENKLAWIQNELENIVQMVVIGTVIILIILLVIRPVVLRSLESRRNAEPEEDQDLQDVISNMELDSKKQTDEESPAVEEDLIDLNAPEDKRKVSLVKQVNDMVAKHPDETISIIRNWLYSNND